MTTEERERLDEACSFIESVPMFHGLAEPKFLFQLARVLTPRSYPPHTFVVEKGQVGQEMYFITSGFVEMMGAPDQPAFMQKGPGAPQPCGGTDNPLRPSRLPEWNTPN